MLEPTQGCCYCTFHVYVAIRFCGSTWWRTFRTFHCMLSIKDGLNWYTVWWKESLNSNGQHFSQYNKTNHHLSTELIEHTKRPRHMTLEIQINLLMVFQPNRRSIIRSIMTITLSTKIYDFWKFLFSFYW
jgi:hypothetical protein